MKCPICGSSLKLSSVGKGAREKWVLICQDFRSMTDMPTAKREMYKCHYHTQWFDTIQKAINNHFEIVDFIENKKAPKKKGWF